MYLKNQAQKILVMACNCANNDHKLLFGSLLLPGTNRCDFWGSNYIHLVDFLTKYLEILRCEYWQILILWPYVGRELNSPKYAYISLSSKNFWLHAGNDEKRLITWSRNFYVGNFGVGSSDLAHLYHIKNEKYPKTHSLHIKWSD